jgi:hypothetical protein
MSFHGVTDNDGLVTVIFDALKKEAVSPQDRRHAIIRAGQIAEAYLGANAELLESVFGSAANRSFENDVKSNDVPGELAAHQDGPPAVLR